jgi:glycosyltransferase involved in cell wall biosynthesis
MPKSLTVFYPCFNQPDQLFSSLESLKSQTFLDFQVILMDDCSTLDYSNVIHSYSGLQIERIKNEENIGAVPNMVKCILYPVETPYKMVFHEDDLLHPQWLEFAINAMEKKNGKVAWAACNMSFHNEKYKFEFKLFPRPLKFVYNDLNYLASNIVTGSTLSFASVIYNSQFAKDAEFLLDKYSMLGDRHLLLELARNHGFIYFDYNLISAFDHLENDKRWKTLRTFHIVNFYSFMSNFFSKKQIQQKEVLSGFTRLIIENSNLIPEISYLGKLKLYFHFFRIGLFSIKYYILSFKYIRNIIDYVKL